MFVESSPTIFPFAFMSSVNVETPTTVNPPPVTLTPFLAVIIPTESIFDTSSYVNVPPMDTLPLKVALPVKVDTPDTSRS